MTSTIVIPEPVTLDATEFDADAMRADHLAHCHGVPRPWLASAVLSSGMRFSTEGVDVDVPFVKDPRRHSSLQTMLPEERLRIGMIVAVPRQARDDYGGAS